MKSPRRIVPKPQFKLQNIIQRLLKEPIAYLEFLELLFFHAHSLIFISRIIQIQLFINLAH